MRYSTKKQQYIDFLDRLKKKKSAYYRSLGVLTQEEAFAKMLSPQKTQNNTDWSEAYAAQALIKIGCPNLQQVDGNPVYNELIRLHQRRKSLKPMLTPDFVFGCHTIEANDPNDFYVDVHEVTEGLWGNFDDQNNKFRSGNPIKAMYEAIQSAPERYTSDRPYRMIVTETNPKLIGSLYENIKKKSEKYCTKRGGDTAAFGMVSVMSNNNPQITMIVFQKLLISIFDDMIVPFVQKNYPKEVQEHLLTLKRNICLVSGNPELSVMAFPFEGNWTFWFLVGYGPYEGHNLLLVNQNGLARLDKSTDVYIWLEHIMNQVSNSSPVFEEQQSTTKNV
ncbi:hypothetical protein [Vibrio fluvialis]|uniref:hypothetical protein n=1 Tax=Vibrio fluvialis TaxID=676 RepID=UPI00096B9175|nr:hypothetical protein [Vibrio fluvialis]